MGENWGFLLYNCFLNTCDTVHCEELWLGPGSHCSSGRAPQCNYSPAEDQWMVDAGRDFLIYLVYNQELQKAFQHIKSTIKTSKPLLDMRALDLSAKHIISCFSHPALSFSSIPHIFLHLKCQ